MESYYDALYLDSHNHSPLGRGVTRISTNGEFLFQERLSLRSFILASSFLQAKAMQNNFRKFEEFVFFDLWLPDSGFRIKGKMAQK